MSRGRLYIAFDYGTRKIGVAIGQDLTGSARALDTVAAGGGPDWTHIEKLLQEWQPAAAVVGVPLAADRGDTPLARRCRRFGTSLSRRFDLPVHFVDETLTSEGAARELAAQPLTGQRRRRLRDQTAARLILESFFNQTGAAR